MKPKPWVCPYCGRGATISDANVAEQQHVFSNGSRHGYLIFVWQSVTCPLQECGETKIIAALHRGEYSQRVNSVVKAELLMTWTLVPRAEMKPIPDYVPAAIKADYAEACLIRDLSPKASATLARRCLQGIIRDFWSISRPRLVDEINDLKSKVDGSTWQAIDAVRQVGNIGAHMEKDINIIVDVEPAEAQILIGLIEILIKDWYVARFDREQHLAEIVRIASEKREVKSSATPALQEDAAKEA